MQKITVICVVFLSFLKMFRAKSFENNKIKKKEFKKFHSYKLTIYFHQDQFAKLEFVLYHIVYKSQDLVENVVVTEDAPLMVENDDVLMKNVLNHHHYQILEIFEFFFSCFYVVFFKFLKEKRVNEKNKNRRSKKQIKKAKVNWKSKINDNKNVFDVILNCVSQRNSI